jgi:hypothetical protein
MAVDVTPLVRVGVLELGRRRECAYPAPASRVGLALSRSCGSVARVVARWERRRARPQRKVSGYYSKALGFAKSLTRPGRSWAGRSNSLANWSQALSSSAKRVRSARMRSASLTAASHTKSLSVRFEAEAARRTTSSTVGVTRMFQRGAAASDTSRNLHSGSVCYPSSSSTPSLLREGMAASSGGVNARAATAATRHGLL